MWWWVGAFFVLVIAAECATAWYIAGIDRQGREPTDHLRDMEREDGGTGPIP